MLTLFENVDLSWVVAVERLGGWAVVVFIVWWMLKRWERVMDNHTKAIIGLSETNVEHHNKETNCLEKIVVQNAMQTKLLEKIVANGH